MPSTSTLVDLKLWFSMFVALQSYQLPSCGDQGRDYYTIVAHQLLFG